MHHDVTFQKYTTFVIFILNFKIKLVDNIQMTFINLFIFNYCWLLLNISFYRDILHSRLIKILENAQKYSFKFV